jgi:AcrR family transcriptional regulator
MSRTSSDQENTKAALVRVATRLFSKQGYHGTSVKQIADAAAVNISLISYHFGGKENLYHACLTPWVASKIEFLEKKILRPTSAEEFQFRLKLFVETGCIIWRDIEHEDPVLQEIFKKTIQPLSDRLVEFMRTGQKQNFIRKDLDANYVALLFLGGVQHAIRIDKLRHNLQGETLHDPKVRQKTISTALDMFFHGMGV